MNEYTISRNQKQEDIFYDRNNNLKENTLRKLASKVINGTQAAEILPPLSQAGKTA